MNQGKKGMFKGAGRALAALLFLLAAAVCFIAPASAVYAAKASAAEQQEKEEAAEKKKTEAPTSWNGVDYSRVYDFDYYTTHDRHGKKYADRPKVAIVYFVKYGMKRGDQGCAEFDPKSYRLGSPALRRVYLNDYRRYYLHYQIKGYKNTYYKKQALGVTKMKKPVTKYGKIELSAIYDYEYYTTKYPAVLKSTGGDDSLVLRDFVKNGLKKNRTGKDPSLFKKAAPASKTYKNLKKKLTNSKAFDGAGITVCIDPGHQRRGDYSREQIGPGSGIYKAKVTSGAYGPWSRKNEYELNLEVSLKLRSELEARGYHVVMTRSKHDVRISNVERAKKANEAQADIMIRIHANSVSASGIHGVLCYAAASNNPYLKKDVIAGGQRLAVLLRNGQAAVTKQRVMSNLYQNDMTGINWAKMPCAIVEMGFMSNPTEDRNMAKKTYQLKIARGLANGVDAYFRDQK